MTRFFICECSDRTCKRKIKLGESEYLKLSKLGAVLHLDHVGEKESVRTERAIVVGNSQKTTRTHRTPKMKISKLIGVRVFG